MYVIENPSSLKILSGLCGPLDSAFFLTCVILTQTLLLVTASDVAGFQLAFHQVSSPAEAHFSWWIWHFSGLVCRWCWSQSCGLGGLKSCWLDPSLHPVGRAYDTWIIWTESGKSGWPYLERKKIKSISWHFFFFSFLGGANDSLQLAFSWKYGIWRREKRLDGLSRSNRSSSCH